MTLNVFEGKHVLVTGGTGSLGSHMVHRLLAGTDGRPSRVTVFSRDEAKQHDLRLALRHGGRQTDEVIYHDAEELVRFRVGDIRDQRSVRRALDGVDLVVHAAAMKQVPDVRVRAVGGRAHQRRGRRRAGRGGRAAPARSRPSSACPPTRRACR